MKKSTYKVYKKYLYCNYYTKIIMACTINEISQIQNI